jgi:hypothetical protein
MLSEAQVDHQRLNVGVSPSAPSYVAVSQGWGSLRYQFDQHTAIGAQVLASRSGVQDSARLLAYREQFVEDASWRLFAGVARATASQTEWQGGGDGTLTWWDTRLSVAIALLQRGAESMGADMSLGATRSVNDRFSFNAGVRRFADVGDSNPSLSANLGLQYLLAPRWVLSATYSGSRGARLPLQTGPSTGAPDVLPSLSPVPRLRLAWIGLRYETSGGTPTVALGGVAGTGGGRIEGAVFLDGNGNAQPDPGEDRLANVTVVLDERYAVRTDAQGRFEFPFVVVGDHKLTVIPDNIPLPWGLGDAASRTITVRQRE